MKGLEIKGYFTIIENEILDYLPLIKLSKRELKIMLVVLRLINGFGKEKDRIPLSLLVKLTGISKGNCSTTVKSLISKKILYKNEGELGINKDFRQWPRVPNLGTIKGFPKWHSMVPNLGKKGVPNLDPSKEKEKETIQIKVFSKKENKDQLAQNLKMLKKLKEDLKRSPVL